MNDKMLILPPEMSRNELEKRFKEFMEEDELVSKEFWKHFGRRRASKRMPVPSIFDCVEAAICYDDQNQFDLRLLITLVHPEDKHFFIEVAQFVSERYTNKPAGPLTLRQFKADLSRRMAQLGF
jgi:hypothetical protein